MRWVPEIDDLADMFRDANAAVASRRYTRWAWRVMGFVAGAGLAGLALVFVGLPAQLPQPLVVGGLVMFVAGAGSVAAHGRLRAPIADPERTARTTFAEHPVWRTPKEAVFDARGIAVSGSVHPWSGVHHVRETERSFVCAFDRPVRGPGSIMFVLLTGERPYDSFPLPKRALTGPGAEAALRSLLDERVRRR